jgi:Leucine-rich repeat (LRR) protein
LFQRYSLVDINDNLVDINVHENQKISTVIKMKSTEVSWITLLGLISVLAGIDANQRTLTCIVPLNGSECRFLNQQLQKDETVTIEARHINTNDQQITRITFENSIIFRIPSEVFEKFPNVANLDIYKQGLQQIEPDSFQHANKLINLNINENSIRNIEPNALRASSLNIFFFRENQLTEISRHTFEGLGNLRILELDFNPITNIHQDAFENLVNLTRITIQFSRLIILHHDLFKNNLNLGTISFGANQIAAMSKTMFSHLKQLFQLNLATNVCINRLWSRANQNFAEIEAALEICNRAYEDQLLDDQGAIEVWKI